MNDIWVTFGTLRRMDTAAKPLGTVIEDLFEDSLSYLSVGKFVCKRKNNFVSTDDLE